MKITANVRKRTTSRCGKSAGSASAAASDTEPRMPDHAAIMRGRQPWRRSRCCGRRSSARTRYGVVFTHAIRVRITARLTAAAWPSSVHGDSPESPSRISGSCSPISTNSSALSRKTSVSQTA